MRQNTEKRIFAGAVIIAVAAVLLYAVYQFLGVFVGAIILFTLLKPIFKKMCQYMNKHVAASIALVLSFVLILLPFYFVGVLAVEQAIDLQQNRAQIIAFIQDSISQIDTQYPFLDIQSQVRPMVNALLGFLQGLLGSAVSQISFIVLSVVLMYFLLYFLLVDKDIWSKHTLELLPFSKKNSMRLIKEFEAVTNSTIISSGLIAIVQGLLVGLSFWAVGLQAPAIWGLVAAIFSFLPVVGTPVVYVPGALYLFFEGAVIPAVLLLLFSVLVTSNIDGIMRPIINRQAANLHPLTSIFGVFFGLMLFGVSGIILGPLLISYFFLLVKIYADEYD